MAEPLTLGLPLDEPQKLLVTDCVATGVGGALASPLPLGLNVVLPLAEGHPLALSAIVPLSVIVPLGE